MESTNNPKPKYEPPKLQVMDESEILAAFQVHVAAATWWTG